MNKLILTMKLIWQGWRNYFLDIISDIKYKRYFDERYRICQKCEFNKLSICQKCGCVLNAKTKAEAAMYVMRAVKNRNLNACIIHPSGIIGPNDFGNSHLTELVKEVSNGKLIACVKGGYDFVDVRDVVDGIISACEKDNNGECYILSNRYIAIKELCDLICDVQGRKKMKMVLPIGLAKLIAPFFEVYYNLKKQTPLFTKYSLYTLSSNANFSNEKAKEKLKFKNRDMKDTIKDTVEWMSKNK